MKKLILILVLLANCHLAVSQDGMRSSVKAGVTYILFGSGDLSGLNYYNEYNRSINRFLTFAPSLHIGYGSKSSLISSSGMTEGLRFTKASVALDANLFFSPMRFERSKVRLGIGPSLRFLSDSHPSSFGVSYRGPTPNLPPGNDYVLNPFVYNNPQNYLTVGYTVILEGELNVGPRWIAGARASFQNYASGETAANIGLNVGYRF
jgi:hypothetical protein